MSTRPRSQESISGELIIRAWERYRATLKEAQDLLRYRLLEIDPGMAFANPPREV